MEESTKPNVTIALDGAGVNAPAAARALYSEFQVKLDAARDEADRLRIELRKAKDTLAQEKINSGAVVTTFQDQILAIKDEVQRAQSSEVQLKTRLDTGTQRWEEEKKAMEKEMDRMREELKEANESVLNARSDARKDSESREHLLREALQSSRDAAAAKTEHAERSAKEKVAAAVSLKDKAEKEAHEAREAALNATRDWEVMKAKLDLANEKRAEAESKMEVELRTLEVHLQEKRRGVERSCDEAVGQADAYKEQVERLHQQLLEAQAQVTAATRAKLPLEEENVKLKAELAQTKAYYAQHYSQAMARKNAAQAELAVLESAQKACAAQLQEGLEDGGLAVERLGLPEAAGLPEEGGALAVVGGGGDEDGKGRFVAWEEEHSASLIATPISRYVEETRLRNKLRKAELERDQAVQQATLYMKRVAADDVMHGALSQVAQRERQAKSTLVEGISLQEAADLKERAAEQRVAAAEDAAAAALATQNAEVALARQEREDAAKQAAAQLQVATSKMDAAVVKQGQLQEEVAMLKSALLAAKEEFAKREALREAEGAAERQRLRLQQEHLAAERRAAEARSGALTSSSPFHTLQDTFKAELELHSIQARRLQEELRLAEVELLQVKEALAAREAAATADMERVGGELLAAQASLAEERTAKALVQGVLEKTQTERAREQALADARDQGLRTQIDHLQGELDREHAAKMKTEGRVDSMYHSLQAAQRAAKEEVVSVTASATEEAIALRAKLRDTEHALQVANELNGQKKNEHAREMALMKDQLAARQQSQDHHIQEALRLRCQLEEAKSAAATGAVAAAEQHSADRQALAREVEALQDRNAMLASSEGLAKEAAEERARAVRERAREVGELEVRLEEARSEAIKLRAALAQLQTSSQWDASALQAKLHQTETMCQGEVGAARSSLAAEAGLRAEAEGQLAAAREELRLLQDGGAAVGISKMQEVQCQLCAKMFTDPHSFAACQHTFCKDCILPVLYDNNAKCPTCERRAFRADLQGNAAMHALVSSVRSTLAK